MEAFQLVEVEGYPNILFSSSFAFSETLYNYNGGNKLAFYEVYELMPSLPPMKPLLRGIFENEKFFPLEIDEENKIVSINTRGKYLNTNNVCSLYSENINNLLLQIDIYLTYNNIGIDIYQYKSEILKIFTHNYKFQLDNLIDNNSNTFSLIFAVLEKGIIFVLKPTI